MHMVLGTWETSIVQHSCSACAPKSHVYCYADHHIYVGKLGLLFLSINVHCYQQQECANMYPLPPLQTPGLARDGPRGGFWHDAMV